ncbi:MAG: hypothetical protein A4E56_03337 [Pelotomaculum sp. PtaU1.Bin065]|nr:MAG: hypothetical protein A4E56_03337 [Pelotomaculum sp. PtaU1.Bin065]
MIILENTALTLVKQEKFGELECDFYKKDDEYYMTREQIGRALDYSEPRVAIAKIHSTNKDRLDKFSTVTKLVTVEGDREVIREVYLYSRKGIYEICRWSRQPKADAFFDWVYDVLEGLVKGELELAFRDPKQELREILHDSDFKAMKGGAQVQYLKTWEKINSAQKSAKEKSVPEKSKSTNRPAITSATTPAEKLQILLDAAIPIDEFNPRSETELKSSVIYDKKFYYIFPFAIERYLGVNTIKKPIHDAMRFMDGVQGNKRLKFFKKSRVYFAWRIPRRVIDIDTDRTTAKVYQLPK